MRAAAILLLLLAGSGCVAPGFLAHQGRVVPHRDVRVSLGSGFHVNGQALDVLRDGRDLARTLAARTQPCPDREGSCWSLEDLEPVADAAFRFAVAAPAASRNEVQARYGFLPGFDVGLRLGPGVKGLDVGWQTHGPRDARTEGWAGTLLAGVGTRSLGALGDVIEDVLQGEAGLTDWQVAYVAGRQWGEYAHTYLGARYTLTRWTLRLVPALPVVLDGASVEGVTGTDGDGFLHAGGAVFGAAVGWQKVFLGAELSLLATRGHARVLFRERDLGGIGVLPAAYLQAQF